MAHEVIRAGREATGTQGHPLHGVDRRVRAQAAHPVPVGRAGRRPRSSTRRLRKLRDAINADRSLGRNVGFRYHDGEPSLVEGLLSRGDRRVGAVIERCWRDGGRFDGWSEHFSYARWMRGAAATPSASTWPGTPPASATATRCCPGTTSTPAWTSSGSGTTGRTRSASSSRTTAAGPRASTAASARPGHRHPDRPDRARRCCRSSRRLMAWRASPRARHRRPSCSGSASATPSAAGCASPRTATSPAPSSARCAAPRCRSPTRPGSRRTPRSPTSARRRPGRRSEAEYLEIGLRPRDRRRGSARRAGRGACRAGLDVLDAVRRRAGLAGRPDRRLAPGGSSCPGVDAADAARGRRGASWPATRWWSSG